MDCMCILKKAIANLEGKLTRVAYAVDGVMPNSVGNVELNAIKLENGYINSNLIHTGTGTGDIVKMGSQGIPGEIIYIKGDGSVGSKEETITGAWKGVFSSVAALPAVKNIGDTADVDNPIDETETGFYGVGAISGVWEKRPVGPVDLTNYEILSNKVGILDTNTDHYPNCKAVSEAIAAIPAGSGPTEYCFMITHPQGYYRICGRYFLPEVSDNTEIRTDLRMLGFSQRLKPCPASGGPNGSSVDAFIGIFTANPGVNDGVLTAITGGNIQTNISTWTQVKYKVPVV